MTNKRSKSTNIYYIYCIMFLLFLAYILLSFQGNRAFKIYAITLIPIALTGIILIMHDGIKLLRESVWSNTEGKITLLLLIMLPIISFLPTITTPYLFGDDLWMYNTLTSSEDRIIFFLGDSRPLTAVLFPPLNLVYWDNSCYARIISVLIAIIITLIIFTWALKCSSNLWFSFAIAALISLSSQMADIVSFLLLLPLLAGFVFSASSMLAFNKSYHAIEKREKIIWISIALSCLIVGMNFYVVSSPIVFVLLGIFLLKKENSGEKTLKRIRFIFVYGIVFLVGAVLFLVSTRALYNHYGLAASTDIRGQLTIGVPQLCHKFFWFMKEVFPQTMYRFIDNFCMGRLTKTNNLLFASELNASPVVSKLLYYFALTFIVVGIILFFRRREHKNGWFYAILEILFIPASYYPFLVLPQDSYMSYYGFCNYCVCVLLVTVAAWEYFARIRMIVQKNCKISFRSILGYILCAVFLSFSTNFYCANSWVNYSRVSHDAAKMQLMNQLWSAINSKKIHIYGYAAPIQLDLFSISLVRQILLEAGENPFEYNITCSANNQYGSGLQKEKFDQMLEMCSDSEKEILLKYYKYEVYFGLYFLQGEIEDKDKDVIERCFKMAGIVPTEGDTVIIDISSIHQWNLL